jgi:hypothetical protein
MDDNNRRDDWEKHQELADGFDVFWSWKRHHIYMDNAKSTPTRGGREGSKQARGHTVESMNAAKWLADMGTMTMTNTKIETGIHTHWKEANHWIYVYDVQASDITLLIPVTMAIVIITLLVHGVALSICHLAAGHTAARAAMTRCIFPSSPSFISISFP